jgi:hypothetical protein
MRRGLLIREGALVFCCKSAEGQAMDLRDIALLTPVDNSPHLLHPTPATFTLATRDGAWLCHTVKWAAEATRRAG